VLHTVVRTFQIQSLLLIYTAWDGVGRHSLWVYFYLKNVTASWKQLAGIVLKLQTERRDSKKALFKKKQQTN
jgi:hypothetical protein